MKHLFMMHSAITYLASLSVISAENLDTRDCLFIYQGNNLGFPGFVNSIFLAEVQVGQWGYVKKIDKIVDDYLKGDSFHVYIASVNALSRILISNKNCVSINFIEEGTASYFSSYNMGLFFNEYRKSENRIIGVRSFVREFKYYLRAILNLYPIKYFRLPLDYCNYAFVDDICFYCTNQYTFPLSRNRKVIPLAGNYKNQLEAQYDLNDQYLWISSKLFDNYPNDTEKLAKIIKDFFRDYIRHTPITKIYVKFHQYEKESSKTLLLGIFEELGISSVVMDDSVIMEIELLRSKNLTMFGDITSLLLYNSLWGNKSISLARLYAKHIKMNPADYSEQVLNTLIGVDFVE